MPRPSFAFLALKEHPYAREMLRQLLAAGHVPRLVVEEDSPVATTERDKFLARLEGHALAATIKEQARDHDIAVCSLPLHDSSTILEALGPDELDLIVLGGTRIIRGAVLSFPREGVINSHPGLLPDCRGSSSPAWSVYHDIPVGSSTHFCDEGIDTGDLLLRRSFEVRRGMSYEDLCHGTLVLAGALMAEALVAHEAGRWSGLRHGQGASPFPTFKNAPPDVLAVVRKKLADETYAHYAHYVD